MFACMRLVAMFLSSSCLLWAGAVLTNNNQVSIGDVTEDKGAVYLQLEFGKMTFKRDKVRWYTLDKRVNSIYIAGLEAWQQKEVDVARLLLQQSMKRERSTSRDAQLALRKINAAVTPTTAASANSTSQESKDDDSQGSRMTAREQREAEEFRQNNPVVQRLAYKLVKFDVESGKMVSADASEIGGKDYYAIYYSAHWCGPCRGFTPQLVSFYKEMKKAHGDNFELIFYSFDNSEAEMATYMKEAGMPWYAIRYDDRRASGMTGMGNYLNYIPYLSILNIRGACISNPTKEHLRAPEAMEKLRELLVKDEPNG